MIDIITSDEQDKIKIKDELLEDIKKVIEACEKEEDVTFDNEISLTFTDNENIKNINREYRNIDSETDVLSFPMFEREDLDIIKNEDVEFPEPLGDIVISLEKAVQQAEEFNHSFEREVCYLVCHSMFHLMGYDHMQEDEKKIMRAKEEKVMNSLNITR